MALRPITEKPLDYCPINYTCHSNFLYLQKNRHAKYLFTVNMYTDHKL